MKTLVLAIGNKLLSDEGAGLHVLNELQKTHPETEDTLYLDGGTLSFTLAGAVSDADNLIVIDAAQLQGQAGTVDCMVNEQMDQFLGACKRSVHEIGLLDLLDISRLTESLPEQRALIGIQPEIIDWGDSLSEDVQKAVPVAVQHALDLLSQWKQAEVAHV
ncbi:MAG: Peptidase M52 [uncultured Thiotrichaceae bacterium]|uniref:Peptidase M52 n=1 Tax=uncultured Thiotrichaceae bacterium TaxID=298394 RepID=A0A6S6UHI0_9GAMM|nr:MAG: Peptidase M52 [uncultured Thiotrichaceae bacterium]